MSKEFDKQPLRKGNPQEIVAEVGFLKVVDRFGKEVKSNFICGRIVLTVGKQFDDRYKSGFGLNHIYYKHFHEIPSSFYIKNKEHIDCEATIVNFINYFLNNKRNKIEVAVYYEENDRPILFRTKFGVMVINYNYYKNYYSITTFSKLIRAKGEKIGYLA